MFRDVLPQVCLALLWCLCAHILFGRNEAEVGQAIKESGVKREHVFVVTKLQKAGHGYDECLEAFNSSLNKYEYCSCGFLVCIIMQVFAVSGFEV